AEDGIRCRNVTGVQTCALPISKVRQTIAETIRVSTCVVSVIDSPRPSWLEPASITSGLPPSSATPVVKDTRVRVEDLSNMIATRSEERRVGREGGCR